jgi:hypothetical protein
MTTTNRAPLFVLASLGVSITVLALFATAMEAGVGMMILLVICAGVLGAIGLVVFRGMTQTVLGIMSKRLDSRAEDYRHEEAADKIRLEVLKAGYHPDDFSPLRQIAAPVQQQIAAPAKGIHFTSASVEGDAINLLLFSVNALGRDSNRIASNVECAGANLLGYNARKWDIIINKYLRQQLGIEIATQPGPVSNGGGAYVPEEIGTIGALYDMLVNGNKRRELEAAVMAIPESPRPRR